MLPKVMTRLSSAAVEGGRPSSSFLGGGGTLCLAGTFLGPGACSSLGMVLRLDAEGGWGGVEGSSVLVDTPSLLLLVKAAHL